MIGRPHFRKAFQVFNDIRKLGSHAHICVRFGRSAINRNPEYIQARIDQLLRFLFGQDRAVGDQFNLDTQRLDFRNPVDRLGMEERFTDTPKVNTGDRIKLLEPIHDIRKSLLAHTTNRLLPGIAETGNTV